MLESRDKAPFDFAQGVVVAWLTADKPGRLAHLQEVTCDVWDGYAEAAKEVFGDTVHVAIDRPLSVVEWHVMKELPGPAGRVPPPTPEPVAGRGAEGVALRLRSG